ncbi:penicillin-binding Protein dimerization domain protein [Wolbachia endosymbiont of Wuchereria bancrofti]|nr:penicillin-binding Protein dimerization domain protein [Wolbachia endosymbiont of Wuchereria bancrofti]
MKNLEGIAAQLCSVFNDLEYENCVKYSLKKETYLDKTAFNFKRVLAVKSTGVREVNFCDNVKCVYPHSNLFSHVLGYSDIDGKGIAGVEAYINNTGIQPHATQMTPGEYVQLIP